MVSSGAPKISNFTQESADSILSNHGKTFHWAKRFLGPTAARQATLLYAFCRCLDDIADGDRLGGLKLLEKIDAALEMGIAGDLAVDVPELKAFLALSEETSIPLTAAHDLITGLICDQGTVAITDQDALVTYAYQVAGTVGLMMAPILGRVDRRADAFAIDLGIAMQLTNIARDVAEDAGLGRRYIPASWCEALTAAEISASIANKETKTRSIISAGIVKILDLSESYYRSGLSGLAYLPWQNHLAIGIAAKVYRAIGTKIVRCNYEWWGGRQVTSGPEKLIASAKSLPLLISRRKKPGFHDFNLHSPLKDIKSVQKLCRLA
tara:strand:- start:265 stop:1233 length:969 start_codon:yes stop_codon:yes gene_type:complete